MQTSSRSSDFQMLRILVTLLAFAMLLTASACNPAVGDECQSNLECDTSTDSVCDVTVPGGYCTVADCVPNGCPDDSVCVEFDDVTSNCMEACLKDGDCRDTHVCRAVGTYGEAGYGFCYVAEGS